MAGPIKRYTLYLSFLFAVIIFFWYWHIYAFSRYPMDGYDEAIRYISRAYVSAGFIPYKDFGIVYAPGIFLPAHIIPFKTLEQQNLVIYSLFLFIVLAAGALIGQFPVSRARFLVTLSGFMIFLIPLLNNENIADSLLGLLIILIILVFRYGARTLLLSFLFIFPFLIIHWRWDRIVTLLIVQFLLFIPLGLWCWRRKKRKRAKTIMRMFLLQVAGAISGLGSLAAYLYSTGGLWSGMEFIYYLPVRVILEYRDLPLPDFSTIPGIPFFFTWLTMGTFSLYIINEIAQRYRDIQTSETMCWLLLIVAPFAGLPYALGRSDIGHIQPMVFFAGLSILLAFLLSKSKRSFILILLLFPLLGPSLRFLPKYTYQPHKLFAITEILETSLRDCRKKTDTTTYRSLFVGRTLYERYFFNNVTLYFLNPSIRPASRHIHDDPGVQSSCIYGSRIAEELSHAPKPMLAFITDQPSEKQEENKTREMKSCGKIEEYLASAQYRVLGTCTSYGIPYEIRLYEK